MNSKLERETVDKLYMRVEKILDNFRRVTGREDLVSIIIKRLADSHANQVAIARGWERPPE